MKKNIEQEFDALINRMENGPDVETAQINFYRAEIMIKEANSKRSDVQDYQKQLNELQEKYNFKNY